jgi:hypothetical protein
VKCAEKLRFEDIGTYQQCAKCRAHRLTVSSKFRLSERERLKRYKELAETAKAGMTIVEQAKKFGLSYIRVAVLRAAARRAGFDVPKQPATRGHHESAKWRELDKHMLSTCSRCGLRGEHECISTRADANARRYGWTFPVAA